MAETSGSQVTITLGRSGQVVKRARTGLENGFADPQPVVGSKRSVRDRLGSNADGLQHDNKRQRGDSNRLTLKAANVVDDIRLDKDDLRFKIMKRTQNGSHQNGMDLREMLSRPYRMATSSSSNQPRRPEPLNFQHNMPEQKVARHYMPLTKNDGKHIPVPRDGQHRIPEQRDYRQHMPEHLDDRLHMPYPRTVRPHLTELDTVRHRSPEPAIIPIRYHSSRADDFLPRTELVRKSNSSWTLNHGRHRSPDRVLHTSRHLSPPRTAGQLQGRPFFRAYEDLETATYRSRDIQELRRPVPAASIFSKPALSSVPMNSASSSVPTRALLAAGAQRSSFMVDGHSNVESFLHSLGLEKYAITLKVEEVDMATLSQMGENDLKELGIPMGPRKKILLALMSRTRRQER